MNIMLVFANLEVMHKITSDKPVMVFILILPDPESH